MLTITKTSDNRVDLDLAGTLDAETMRNALSELIEKSEGVSGGRMLYKISDFAFPTLGAIGVEMGYLPKLFGLLGKFDKCAVLSDAAWIRNAAELEGRMFPGIEIKAFAMDDSAAAEAWLARDPGHSMPV
jgi:hypothetical protein